jgi:hypothetical protein
MMVTLMGLDLHLEGQVVLAVLQEEGLVVPVLGQEGQEAVRMVHLAEGLVAVVVVGIAETSNAKVLVGTMTGIRNGPDISLRFLILDALRFVPKVTVYVAAGSVLWMVFRCVSAEVGLFIAFLSRFAFCFLRLRKYHQLYIDKYTAKASINFMWRLEHYFLQCFPSGRGHCGAFDLLQQCCSVRMVLCCRCANYHYENVLLSRSLRRQV